VDLATPGVTVRPILNIAGEEEFCEVFFDNVRVPAENLVGRLHEGWSLAKSLLAHERYGGTNEVQRNIVARQVLELPA
jgi:alkylation response protein AidB-like acyl-CoA dehydrogenase